MRPISSRPWPLLAATCTLLAIGCTDPDPTLYQPLDVRAPVEVGGALLFVNPSRARIDVVAADGPRTKHTHLAYDGVPTAQLATPDGKRLILLDPAQRSVAVASASAVQVSPLPSPFSALAVSEDGAAGAAWHAASANTTALVNPAEIALLDVAGSAAPRVATVTGLSRQPVAVHVSPPVEVPGGAHRLVWLDAPAMVGLADFGPTGVRTVVVPLSASQAPSNIVPRNAIVRVVASTLHLYLVADGLGDVLHLTIDLGAPQLAVSIDQIAAGQSPVDLHVFQQASGGLRVLTVNAGSQDLALLDPATGTGFTLDLGMAAAHIVPFAGPDGLPRAALWSAGYNSLWIADLNDLTKKRGKAVHRVQTDQTIYGLHVAGNRLLLVHGSAQAGLSLYDAGTGQLTSFKGTGQVKAVRVTGERAWVLGEVDGTARLARIDLADLHGNSLTLNQKPVGLHVLGSGVAVSGAGLGAWWLAAFPTGDLDATKATFLEGFAFENLYGGTQ